MRRLLLPALVTLLSLLAVSQLVDAEDAPRAPRNVRRAARRAEREAHARAAAPRGLSDGLTSAGRHAPLTPRLAAHQLTFDESEMIVVTSNEFLPPPCRPVTLREGVFSATSEPEPIAVPGNIIQSREFLPPLPPRDSVDQITILEPARPEPIVTPGVAAAQPILRGDTASNVLSRVVVAGELAGVVLPEPARLDPGILQASLNQLPVAVTGAIAFAEEAPPPLPPREQAGKPGPAADLCDEFGVGCVLTLDQIKSARGSDEEARIEAALNQPVSLHFDKASLSKVFQHIANSQGINIVVDDTGLAEEGVTTHEPVSINVDGVMLKSALDLLLHSRNLDYLIEHEVLKITSRQRREGELIAQVYSVADLIGRASSVESATSQSSEAVPRAAPSAADFENVVELIRSTIQPNSWNESGGPAAIVPHPGSRSLVIRQTRRGHLEIAHLLDGIRRVMKDVQPSHTTDVSTVLKNGVRSVIWEADESSVQADQEQSAETSRVLPTSADSPAENQHSRASPVKQPIERVLDRTVSLHFNDTPLESALRDIAQAYGIDVVVDEAGLAAASVTSTDLISLNVDGIYLRSALNLLLKPINLDYLLDDQVLTITNSRRRHDELTVRVYPVADLVLPVRRLQPDELQSEERLHASTSQLIDQIKLMIDPESWIDSGAARITLDSSTLSLVVRQSSASHLEISEFLDQLRELDSFRISLEINAVRVSKDDFIRIRSLWNGQWYGNRVEADADSLQQLLALLNGANSTTILPAVKEQLYFGQTWRLPNRSERHEPFAFVSAIPTNDRRSIDCNIAVPRVVDGKQMLQRVTVFTTGIGNTCVLNASEPSPAIEDFHFGGYSHFGLIRELNPGEGDGVIWDEAPDSVTLVFITPRIIVSEEQEEPLAPSASRSDHAGQPRPMITVTPRITIQEEEEELLGLPLDPLPVDLHSDQNGPQPAPPPGVLPDSFDLFGIPTHDLLFRVEESEQRLILQHP